MWCLSLFTSLLFVVCYVSSAAGDSDHEKPKLLVLSLDAFRPEYFNRDVTPFMEQFREHGSYAPFMRNVFPTKTFVNHFSIATGLYSEGHGVLSNSLFDPTYGSIGYSNELFHYDNDIVPIWTLNEMRGGHSGCMMWPGSNFEYQGQNCSFTQVLDKKMHWTKRIETIMSWFKDDSKPANLVMMYMEEPDEEGHAYSPDAEVETDMVEKLDFMIEHLEHKLVEENLHEKVNVIIVSDHGMETVEPRNFIDLTKFLTPDTYKMYSDSPVLQIVPVPGYHDEIMERLTKASEIEGHFKVYDKSNVPERWRMSHNRRFGPIIAVAEPKYGFQDMNDYAKWFQDNFNVPITPTTKYGVHGYDNALENMHAIFMAQGPAINHGKVLPVFDNVELYGLFCKILEIQCIATDGSDPVEIWSELLKQKQDK